MKALCFAALALLALPAAAGAKSWPPRDTCAAVEGARDWRRTLVTAVANRDVEMLLPLFSEQVLLDFGGGSGHATLRERLDEPTYMLWEELDQLLRLGCAASDDGFVLPWYWSQDISEVDGMEGMLAAGTDIPFRAAPSEDAPVIARLSWHAVQLAGEWDPQAEFLPVALPDGRSGYVRQGHLRSLIAHRLLVGRVEGKLLATAFVAGD